MDIDPPVSKMYRRDFSVKPQQNGGFKKPQQNIGTPIANSSAQVHNAQRVKRPRECNYNFRPLEKAQNIININE